jgi:hypothetical protein
MKDPRIQMVKERVLSGEIKMLSQIFEIIPTEELACMIWLQEHPEYTEVPENDPEADLEIYAWILKLLNPQLYPDVMFYFKDDEEKYN